LDANAGYRDSRIGWSGEKAFQYLYDQWVAWYKQNDVDVCVYCWGDDTSNAWSRFRVDNDNGFIKALLEANTQGKLEPVPTKPLPEPLYTPDPFTAGESYKINTPGAYINVRATPSISSAIMGQVSDGDIVTVYEETLVAGEYWRKIGFGALKGFASMQGGSVHLHPYFPPPVVIPPPVIEETVTVTFTKAEYTAWLAFRAAMERAAVQTVTVSVKAA
jgi:hypothetical protein